MCGVEHAEAVRADEPHPAGAAGREQLGLQARAVGADLGEARREHDERAHARGGAVARDGRHGLRGDGDHGEVDRPGHVARSTGGSGRPAISDGLRVDDVQRTAEPAAIRFSSTAAPTLPGRREAPMIATEAAAVRA